MLVFPWITLILVWIQWRFWSLKKKLFFSFSAKLYSDQVTSKQSRSPSIICWITFVLSVLGEAKLFLDTTVFIVYLKRLWFQKLKGSYGKRVTKNLQQCDCGDWVKLIDTVFIYLRYLYIQYSYILYIILYIVQFGID